MKRYGNQCIRNCQNTNHASEYLEDLSAVADLYIQGYALEFEQLFSSDNYSRISLPTYPFSRERYWVPKAESKSAESTVATSTITAAIHPLLHQNTSNFSEQRFSTIFTGQEFFLKDHVLKGQRVLPGVVYLEMARAAVELAAGDLEEGTIGIQLKNVVWLRTIGINDRPVRLHIKLFPEDNGEILYEIYSQSEGNGAERVVHIQGSAALSTVTEVSTEDIKALQAQCSQSSLSPGQCYEAFRAMGLECGPGHRGIEKVYVGTGQVLAKLSLPSAVSHTQEQFVLHPSVMDSALQSSIGLIMGAGNSISSGNIAPIIPALPFALEKLDIFGKCTPSMWALIRYSDGSKAGDKIGKLDIDLCDNQGIVCVRMKGLSIYPCNSPSSANNIKECIPKQGSQFQRIKSKTSQNKDMEELMCRLLWGQMQSMEWFTEKSQVIADLKTKTGLRDLYDRWFEESIAVLERNNYLTRDGESLTVIDTAPADITALWKEWDGKKGAWLKDPNTKAQAILVEATLRALLEILTGKVPATDIMFPNSSMELVEGIYKNNVVGDYFNEVLADTLVAFIEERIKEDSSVKIKIIEIGAGTGGTSTMVFKKLKPFQNHIQEYCYTDLSKAFLMHAEREYGQENPYLTYAIFNVEMPIAEQSISAGEYDIVIATNVLHATKNIRQTLRNVKAVLKNNGLILLNEISRNFLFAHLTFGLLEGWWLYEDQELRIPGCPGLYPQTWQEVLEDEGFRSVSFPAQEANELGQQIITAESDGVVQQKQELKPIATPAKQSAKIKASKKESPKQSGSITKSGGITQDLLRQKGTAYIKKLVGETLKTPSDKIDSSEPLEKYGIDSILIVQLTNALRKVFDNIDSATFFEYPTIDDLVEYLIKTQKKSLIRMAEVKEHERVEELLSHDEIHDLPSPVSPKPALRKYGRFL